jgi:hypothetical protein
MSDLKKAAEAWDRAQREGRLNAPAPEPDTRPRDALYNRVISIEPKVTIGRGRLVSPYPSF